jgi:hypothetical protein
LRIQETGIKLILPEYDDDDADDDEKMSIK